MKSRAAFVLATFVLSSFPVLASASSACYQDPVYDQTGTVEATTDVRVRSAACVSGTSVLFTVRRGTSLELTGRTDGWYRVRDAQGREGWLYDGYARVVSAAAPVSFAAASYAPTLADTRLLNGVRPQLANRPSEWLTALAARASALSVRVNAQRTAYVLSEVARMAREIAASRAVAAVPAQTVPAKPVATVPVPVSTTQPEPAPVASAPVPSTGGSWNIPNVDESRVRAAWLGWYNAVRADLGLAAYSYDARLDATALEWSGVGKSRGSISHKRDLSDPSAYNYAAITKWFGDRGLVFTNVNRVTHTENIGFGYFKCPASGDCTDALISGIRDTFDMYMAEKANPGPWNGAHYKSVTNKYFKIVGLGIVVSGNKYYLTVHYGTSVK